MSNIAVKIIADVTDLQVQFQLARQESQALTKEFNNLAAMARSSGSTMRDEVQAAMQQAAASMLEAKAQTAALSSQLKEAQTSSSGFGQGLSAMQQGLAALGLAGAISELAAFSENVENTAANMAHEAQVLSLTTAEYEAFREAATDSGVETSAVDTAIQRFNKSLGDAQEGLGNGAKAFNELGVSSHQATAEALAQVSAMMLTKSAADQQRLSVELFSRSGAEMIPLYKLWAEGAVALNAQYDAQGRSMAGVAAAALQTKITGDQLSERMASDWAPAALAFSKAWIVAKEALIALQEGAASADPAIEAASAQLKTLAATQVAVATGKPVTIVAPGIAEQVADLAQLTPKLGEIVTLTKNLATARATLAAIPSTDTKDIATAEQVIAILQKEKDEMTKPEANPAAKEQLDAIQQEARAQADLWRQAANEKDEIERESVETQISLAKGQLDQEKQLLEQEFNAHQITAQQKYDATVAMYAKIYNLELQALSDEMANDATSVVQKAKDADQILLLNQQLNTDVLSAAKQLTADLKTQDAARFASYKAADDMILNTEGQLVKSIFSGRMNLGQSIEQFAGQMVEDEVTNDLKMLTERELVNAGMLASDKATAQEGMLWKLLFGQQDVDNTALNEAKKTAAQAAAEASRLASQASAATAGAAISKATNVTEATGDAVRAAQGAYAAVSGIPVVGPIMAPIAAAAAFTAVEAFGSFDQGVNVVPQDMIAQIHAGERIIPAADNSALEEAVNRGSGGGGDIHLHVSAVDAGSVQRLFQNNGAQLSRVLTAQIRNLNPWLRNAMTPT